ncbi:MAG: hypothetical protein SGJ18_15885 [Pseudomonadota bacterium]|nr:hypothetical protein [Pseudomonadota bacterium]
MIKTKNPRETHPYGHFVPKDMSILLLGSFPIGQFTNPKRRRQINPETEIDFNYGGAKNQFWRIIEKCFDEKLNSVDAIQNFLTKNKMGLADVIESCRRKSGSSADSDLYDINFNPHLEKLLTISTLRTVLFTSKNVERWFFKHWQLPQQIKGIVLISPSGRALASLVQNADYKKWRIVNPSGTPTEFRLFDYERKLTLVGMLSAESVVLPR